MSRRSELTFAEAALRGAAAGLAGGLAVLAAEALAERHVISSNGSTHVGWAHLARRAARRAGASLGGRQQTAAAIAAHLLYSASLGAIYGVVQSRRELSSELEAVLDAVLLYIGALPAKASRGRGVGRRGPRIRKGFVPLHAHSVFPRAMSSAFRALARV